MNRHLILTLLPGGQEHMLQVTILRTRTRIYPSIFIYFPIGPFTVALEHSQGCHCVSLWRGNSVTTVMKMSFVQVGSIMHPKRNQCQRFLTPHLYSCQTKSCVTARHPWDTFHNNWSKWLDNNDNIAVTEVKHHELIELSQDHLPT